MAHTFYWRGALGDSCIIEEHTEALNRLTQGTYAFADLEMLKGHRDIFSYRLNDKGRLLFTTIEVEGLRYILLLEHLPTHDYHTSRFLRSGVLKRYLVQNAEELQATALEFQCVDARPLALEALEQKGQDLKALDYYQHHFIQLSDAQEAALTAPLPAIISGVAGSGKSYVGTTLLSNIVANHHGNPSRILYITQSANLIAPLARAWRELPIAQAMPDQLHVEFKTYEELLRESGELEGKTLIGRADFDAWFKNYKDTQNKIAKLRQMPSFELDSDTTYQEFRIAAAFDETGYLNLGARQSSRLTEERQLIFSAYNTYQKRLHEKALLNPAFHQLRAQDIFDLVVVDEAQDFSHLELQKLAALARHRAIAYCIDTHQSLFDIQSKRDFLANMFKSTHGAEVAHIELPISYRCPLKIARAATAMIQAKYRLTGGAADKHEMPYIAPNIENDAGIGHLFVLDEKTLSRWEWLNQQAQGAHFAVITSEAYVDSAAQLFPRNRVFLPLEIKGLEYDTVVVFYPFSNLIFKDAYRKEQDTAPAAAIKSHRAKAGVGDNTFGPAFNEIIVSLTRARKTVIVCDNLNPRDREVAHFLAPLHELVGDATLTDAEVLRETSLKDWEDEMLRQSDQGNKAHAFDIYRLKINPGANPQVFDDYLLEKRPIKTAAVLIAETPHVTPTAAAAVKSDTLQGPTSIFPPVCPKKHREAPVVKKLLTKSKEEHEVAHILDLLANFSIDHLAVFLRLVDFDKYWFKTPVMYQGIKATLFSHVFTSNERTNTFVYCVMSNIDLRKKILFKKMLDSLQDLEKGTKLCLENKTKLLRVLTIQEPSIVLKNNYALPWLKKELKSTADDGIGETLLYWLSLEDTGISILKLLLTNHYHLFRLIPPQNWGKPWIEDANACPLYLITKSNVGLEFLHELLIRSPIYFRKIPAQAWGVTSNIDAGNEAFTSPLSSLTSSEVGEKILDLMIDNHPDILSGIPKDTWTFMHPVFGRLSPLYWLSAIMSGRCLFLKMLDKVPDIVRDFDPVGFSLRVPAHQTIPAHANSSSLLILCKTAMGQQILSKLLDLCPDLIRMIPPYAWAQTGGESMDTPISSLAVSISGKDALEKLLINYPEVVRAIPTRAWTHIRMEPPGEGSYRSALYCLTETYDGLCVLNLFLGVFPEIVFQIPKAEWILALQGLSGPSTPLIPLMGITDSEEDNTIFLRFLFKLFLSKQEAIRLSMNKQGPSAIKAVPPTQDNAPTAKTDSALGIHSMFSPLQTVLEDEPTPAVDQHAVTAAPWS